MCIRDSCRRRLGPAAVNWHHYSWKKWPAAASVGSVCSVACVAAGGGERAEAQDAVARVEDAVDSRHEVQLFRGSVSRTQGLLREARWSREHEEDSSVSVSCLQRQTQEYCVTVASAQSEEIRKENDSRTVSKIALAGRIARARHAKRNAASCDNHRTHKLSRIEHIPSSSSRGGTRYDCA
eukprot:1983405-Rhodomonas_salina.2